MLPSAYLLGVLEDNNPFTLTPTLRLSYERLALVGSAVCLEITVAT